MHPEVTRYLFTDPVITMDKQRQWYEEMKEKGDSFYWIVNFEDVDIGYASIVDIDRKNQRGDSRMYIGELEYRGRGLGKRIMKRLEKYAFDILYLHKLYCSVLSENYIALMTYLKNGWRIKGVLKDHIFKYDRFYDVYMIEILKKDWIK